MAENITSLELNGIKYALGKSIYAELDLSLERFVELLGRDFYCPTLNSAPTSSTKTYQDTDDSVNTFQVGQPCRWKESDGTYRLAVLADMTSSSATWYKLPVKVSELSNDAGYLTQHQDISGKLDKTEASETYLTKADAFQTYLDKNDKAASAVTADSSTKATQDGNGNVIADTYATKGEVNEKQDAVLKFTNLTASSWVSDSTYADYPYRCDISCSGVTADMFAEVVFGVAQSTSGNYAPVCETKAGAVSVWSNENTTITIPTIIITK